MKSSTFLFAALFIASLLAGCGSQPPLITKSATVPVGIDLSGNWRLRTAGGPDNGPDPREQTIRIPPSGSGQGRSSSWFRDTGSAVRVFLEQGTDVKITQTEYGMFMQFDRARVEEYRFGENRIVSVGPIEAERVSGWDGRIFAIETRDDKGAMLFESWSLSGDGKLLTRRISIVERGDEKVSTSQYFDRQ